MPPFLEITNMFEMVETLKGESIVICRNTETCKIIVFEVFADRKTVHFGKNAKKFISSLGPDCDLESLEWEQGDGFEYVILDA